MDATSTTQMTDMLSANIDTAWDFLVSVFTTVLPFAIGIAVLAGGVYFILRRLRIIK